ncbi:uncharacterized protein FA14DRAFT_136026 [Meira miltonrushii]|uniref:PhoD-like phosphatase domain-containing protein n=1 Tax=Meira miltonrushii TaxID=1280837 RepID=A0A316V7U3_9BASI|nr:uncharacterized protein FA14DRAFT_136026 [Meira miltonrushii]PWN33689.1 hypothetical protein FA14DRAFT_136026 [Meira miltonrushii]
MTTLNVKCGPMLRYDTVENDIYHAFALIVTADENSDYSSQPSLQYKWSPAPSKAADAVNATPAVTSDSSHKSSGSTKIYTYTGKEGSFSFWRFKLEIPMADHEQIVAYSIDGQAHPDSTSNAVKDATGFHFFVPAKQQNFRWIGHSCNGFSASLDPAEWNGPDPLWNDCLKEHEKKPFHAVVGGGDQIYCDKLTGEPEMKPWVDCEDPKKRMKMELTEDIKVCMERYFFHHYCEWFGGGSFSRTIAQVPMVNMLDDHDLIDGFGTYPDDLMEAPVFNNVGRVGFKFYYLFQQFINPDVDGISDEPGKHPVKSIIIGRQAAYVQYPHMSFLTYFGPKQQLLLIDCRAERKVHQICSKESYQKIFDRVRKMPQGVEHLVILLGVPLAYPRMVFLERTLSSSFNPIVLLAKGLSPGFTNKFNGQVELLDDLNDHWCAVPHKRERNWLVERIQEISLEKHVRSSFISGDVHACGVGLFFGYHQHDPSLDPKYMMAVITSAIVNSPPPPAVISMLNKLAAKKHRSLFYIGTKETMVPLFDTDLQGKPHKDKYIMGARNWCAVDYLEQSGELEFDLRIETEKGNGITKSFPTRAPAPKWQIEKEHHKHLHTKEWEKIMRLSSKVTQK